MKTDVPAEKLQPAASATERMYRIVEEGMCVGCGLCESLAGKDVIEMRTSKLRYQRPHVVGDTIMLNGQVTIKVLDDTPEALAGMVMETVDESDLVAPSTSAMADIAPLVDFGADGPGAVPFTLKTDVSGLLAQGLETVTGTPLTYAVAGDTLTASAGGQPVFTLVLTGTGEATFTLFELLDNMAQDPLPVDFSSVILASDGDGDAIMLDPGQLIFKVLDHPNGPPVITSNPGGGGPTASLSVDEKTTFVTDVNATDPDSDPVTFSITGGADAGAFGIDMTTGVLSFNAAPDFEIPGDAGGNNIYDVQVTATDIFGLTDVQDIAVTVTDDLSDNPFLDTFVSSLATSIPVFNQVPGHNFLFRAFDGINPVPFTNLPGTLSLVVQGDFDEPTEPANGDEFFTVELDNTPISVTIASGPPTL